MKVSTRVRYGVRLMLELALNYGKGPVLLKDAAARQDISDKYLGQIILPLKSSGLVSSIRGARGGYLLARPPRDVTVMNIVEALEGELNLVECVNSADKCSRSVSCVSRNVWVKLEKAAVSALNSVTLADLVKGYNSSAGAITYNI